jgi:hypothetical protein
VHIARFDDLGRGAWIALIVLSFWFWWPVGVAVLGYRAFIRHRNGYECGPGRWYNTAQQGSVPSGGVWGQGNNGAGQGNAFGGGWNFWSGGRRGPAAPPPSGNRAFDEYRAETIRRLEDEQREFVDYLERLRQARDKAEFDGFMAERRNRQTPQGPIQDV